MPYFSSELIWVIICSVSSIYRFKGFIWWLVSLYVDPTNIVFITTIVTSLVHECVPTYIMLCMGRPILGTLSRFLTQHNTSWVIYSCTCKCYIICYSLEWTPIWKVFIGGCIYPIFTFFIHWSMILNFPLSSKGDQYGGIYVGHLELVHRLVSIELAQ